MRAITTHLLELHKKKVNKIKKKRISEIRMTDHTESWSGHGATATQYTLLMRMQNSITTSKTLDNFF